jgi:hypothetical protein
MPTPREIDWFLRSEMAEFFMVSSPGRRPFLFDHRLLTLFHVFLKSARPAGDWACHFGAALTGRPVRVRDRFSFSED